MINYIKIMIENKKYFQTQSLYNRWVYQIQQQNCYLQKNQQPISEQISQSRKSQPLFNLKKRQCLQIKFNNNSNYFKIKKGHPTETKHMTQYTAVHTAQFLKTIIKNENQIPKIRGNNCNFHSFRSLFGFENEHQNIECVNIRMKCQKYYRKADFLKQIIKQKRQITQKKIIVKYINKVHMIPINPQLFDNWKDTWKDSCKYNV